MRPDHRRLGRFIVLCGDVLLLYGALFTALLIRYRSGAFAEGQLWAHAVSFTPIFLVWLLIFYGARLYDAIGPRTIAALLQHALTPLLINLALAIGYFYIFGARLPGSLAPRTNLALFFALFATLFILWRRIAGKMFGESIRERAVIVGDNTDALYLAEALRSRPEYGYRIVCAVSEPEWDMELLRKLIREEGVTTVIASPHSMKKLAPHLTELAALNIDFWDIASFYEARLEKIPLGMLDETWLLTHIIRREPRLFMVLKNILDRTAALVCIALTLPLWPLIALAIAISSPGPILYRQTRVGKGGRNFTLYKFRTMRPDAERRGAVWAEENDPRVTPVGRILRKLHLDELPQLVNILGGDMSFVGPRPERPEFVKELERHIPFYSLRHMVKPGLTGWAQLNFRYGASIEDSRGKLEYDLYYLKNRSLALDIAIMLKTLHIILRGGTGR